MGRNRRTPFPGPACKAGGWRGVVYVKQAERSGTRNKQIGPKQRVFTAAVGSLPGGGRR